jgi:hypothetical protein
MDWSALLPWVGLVLLLCVLVLLVWWYARRSWLERSGGVFSCELNLGDADHPHWVLGVARYSGEHLEWFRALSLGLRPKFTFRRSVTTARGAGVTKEAESLGQRMLRLEAITAGEPRSWEFVMDVDSATGLLAWLEAAPPSVDRFKA